MNRKIVAILLSTFVLTSAGNALAESPATINAVSIGGGVHLLGSAGPVFQYEYLRNDALAIGGRYLLLDYTYKDEVYEAAGKAMLRLGYNSQDKNPQLGRITGNGFFDCGGGLAPPVTMAVYCRQISTKPETQLTIIPGSSMSIQPCPRA